MEAFSQTMWELVSPGSTEAQPHGPLGKLPACRGLAGLELLNAKCMGPRFVLQHRLTQFPHPPPLAEWPWASHPASLDLTFLICKMGMLMSTTSQGYYEDQISQYTAVCVIISGYNHSDITWTSKCPSKIFISLIKGHRYYNYSKDLMLHILSNSPIVVYSMFLKCVIFIRQNATPIITLSK